MTIKARNVMLSAVLAITITYITIAHGGHGIFKRPYDVKISGSAANISTPTERKGLCAALTLSEEKVKAYFENASAISLEQAIGDHDWPDCYVYGEVVERHAAGEAQIGGFTHEWKIWPNGLGVLHYDVGPSQFLYYPMGR